MATSTLQYPPEILGAQEKKPDELEAEGRLLLGLKYYENGELSGGLAAQLAGISRTEFTTFLESTVYRPSEKRPKTLKNPWQMQEKLASGFSGYAPITTERKLPLLPATRYF